uniref:Intraflagellar transport protein 46 homolog n=1 Tax=Bicosoecida sp. CB-2014 TaxID=1486930 RepID=A0A7S1GBS6_9STRA|mmetsp:Transcript_2771/g.9760  ORF Transcript_2771/g.9760 Transcript_2771/m.9760 type:complete len:465 (+) Transcript_2771:244-1638(+)|eukprot:CAMPEP_0203807974 /NCGR_PEP_ID=MMETSP0115-20131106/1349_1 /ASSEMBLY_ACC=CAM_ASM_000227 /TAXON_ID=33651 /ORGANISM="Bicosoecid sp, Strain ms1" /LENGTH=464 /DNA_ID=CAMNT_0050716657 /DNA_START=244 /DNA_END=1638 /DNA_ORIENTATION=+
MADDSAEFSESGEFEDGREGGKNDDDEFSYDNSFGDSDASPSKTAEGGAPGARSTVVQNQPYDEAVDLSSSGSLDESVDTQDGGATGARPAAAAAGGRPGGGMGGGGGSGSGSGADEPARGDSPPRADESTGGEYPHDERDAEIPGGRAGSPPASSSGAGAGGGGASGAGAGGSPASSASESSSEEDEEEEGGGGQTAKAAGAYNPAEYAHLQVSSEVRELFQYIGRYKPHNIELDTKLRCFIPDYIPAVGDIDAFLKVGRPDGKPDDLGLKVLDEPSPAQSDATVLDLQLRSISKKSNLDPILVRSIDNADKNPKEITKWINSVNELHRSKPPPQVHYTKAMPDIESLMQVWPEEVEDLLGKITLPSADMEMDIKEYAATICAIMDIPVYTSTVQSLHVLFTLYSEFKTNAHFLAMQSGVGGGMGGGMSMSGTGTMTFGGGGGAGGGGGEVMTMGTDFSESKG